ncbi:SDR family NAD(P)-dependent oxidoreductase [Ruegeria sp. 2012CJ41-6]|uniref:SDR family NAD(P)-dependent oxidoreductase n=1 Tax=Ruegeria spongiae TaxID=2942209 RepID=A0ABT0Q5J3_9RHOB|nr:type I polyketide synthase [Ruegeria spongiae]MCL6285141.1 SDR family NAD(P)-dependent oxidoreductase [Ruegeria spongiae]
MSDFLDRISQFSQKKLTLLAAQLRDRVEALETRDKIAIVGVGCRFPGGIDSPENYWDVLMAQRDVISEVPTDRWDVNALYDPDPERAGKITTRFGGWLDDVDRFDPKFFSISPREAQSLDPQQRLLMEVTWRALENAGLPAASLSGSKTGVFCGISGVDYHSILRAAGTENYDAYMASGVAHSVASGRLSYFLGVHGPSLSIDTACSSSLVAIHEAVQSLRRRECDVALAGGSNLILTPETTIALSRAQMMAPDGRCKTFDARANGFVRSEGCGMIVLKRLSDAQNDNDPIIAVIRGSAINQDGRSNGLTAPNGVAQEAVLRAALKDASVGPGDIGFVEAHGTGTALGDPIEVHALGAALCSDRGSSAPLRIGSVKSSIGHLEAAAGVASLIKVALSVHHGRLPGQANLETLNPLIQWDRLNLEPQHKTGPWPEATTAMAGVSSFGFSGTNVHMILEKAPKPPEIQTPTERGTHLLTVSARSSEALVELKSLRAAEVTGALEVPNIAYSANAGRDHFPHRFATVSKNGVEAYSALRDTGPSATVFSGTAPRTPPGLAFVFTGQGSQYAGMSKVLYDRNPVFRSTLDRFDRLLANELSQSLIEILHGTASDINNTAMAQPALLAVELALAELWQSWGLRPKMVLGHSLGEFAAACVADILSPEDALRLVAERGRLMAAAPGDGAMVSVVANEAHIRDRLSKHPGRLSIAAVNGPSNVVISGDRAVVDQFCAKLDADGIHTTALQVSQAFHSPLMDPILDRFEAFAANFDFDRPKIDLISNVSGKRAAPHSITARYWRDHIRSTVRFQDGLQTAKDAGCDLLLEIGPHPVLMTMAQLNSDSDGPEWVASLCRGEDDETRMLAALAQLYVKGAEVNWQSFDAPWNRSIVPVAGHPFQRDRYWVEEPSKPELAQPASTSFPGRKISQSISDDVLLEMQFNLTQMSWIRDHRIHGGLAVPSPVFMSWALQVGRDVLGSETATLEQFTMHRPLHLEEDHSVIVQFAMARAKNGAHAFTISAQRDADTWTRLCEGRILTSTSPADMIALEALRTRLSHRVDVAEFYSALDGLGLAFGPGFRGATEIFEGKGQALARVERPDVITAQASGLLVHPALLDSSLHVIAAALSMGSLENPYLLLSVSRIESLAPLPDRFWCHVSVDKPDTIGQRDAFVAQLQLIDDAGQVLMRFRDISLRRVSRQDFAAVDLPPEVSGIIHEVIWNRESPQLTPGELAELILPNLDKMARENGLYDTYPTFQKRLDQLCSAYIINALKSLGLRFVVDEVLVAENMMRDLTVLPAHRRLLVRMLQILGEDGVLAELPGGWRVLRSPEPTDAENLCRDLLSEFPGCEPKISVTARCARELASVLSGAVDPLTLLFPEGSLAQTEKLYSDVAPARTYNAAIAGLVAQVSRRTPDARRLRILEIGAGTGSATAGILEGLGERSYDYLFTDISPLFLNAARQRFRDLSNVRFAALDISQDPLEQGLDKSGFDVVIAGNVVHATKDVSRTLGNVASLMAPNGKLILLEGTAPQRFGDLTVGMLDGWWAYTDTNLRSYALMPRDSWISTLHECGFEDAIALPGSDARGTLQEQAIFIANWPAKRQLLGYSLIVGEGKFAAKLADQIKASGASVVSVPANPVKIAQSLNAQDFDRIVFLGAMNTVLSDDMPVDQISADQKIVLNGALELVQAVARLKHPPKELVFVTEGGQATHTGENANPAQATLWGFAHTVAMENPELKCRRIDLQAGKVSVAHLVTELMRQDGETQVAIREGQRLLRRLRNCGSDLSPSKPEFPSDETVLITGGLNGLGLLVAEWTVEHGARDVALLGRSSPSSATESAIVRMRDAGAEVSVLKADIGKEEELKIALDQIAALPPVKTVIHAAGALDDGALLSLDWPKFETVLNAKLRGSWLLHSQLPDLRNFVMFSSGASLAGSAGQANHASANAFEDALAWYLRAKGHSALTINWGLWGDVGAGAEIGVGKDADVLQKIDPMIGLAALGAAMSASSNKQRPQLAILDADWQQLAHGTHANAVFFSGMAGAVHRPAASEPAQVKAVQQLREQLSRTPANRRRAVLLDAIRTHARAVLGLAPEDVVEAHEPLNQLGLDSLMAVQLRNILSDAAGLPLPATVIFDHPTIATLTDFLLEQLDVKDADEMTGAAVFETGPRGEPAGTETSDMTEEELAQHLLRELDRLDQGHNQ